MARTPPVSLAGQLAAHHFSLSRKGWHIRALWNMMGSLGSGEIRLVVVLSPYVHSIIIYNYYYNQVLYFREWLHMRIMCS